MERTEREGQRAKLGERKGRCPTTMGGGGAAAAAATAGFFCRPEHRGARECDPGQHMTKWDKKAMRKYEDARDMNLRWLTDDKDGLVPQNASDGHKIV